jgi:urease accessory protein
LVAGDRISLDVAVGAGATVLLATQASTKVYRSDGEASEQRLAARVADGAFLALWPDPVCCFAGARYRQEQEIALDAGGSLLLVDGVVAGRVARGERWSGASYFSRTRVFVAGQLRVHEALRLVDDAGVPSVAERLAGMDALAVAILLGPRVAPLAAQLVAQLAAAPAVAAPLMASASAVADGALLRVAGRRPDAVAAWLRRALCKIAVELGEDPWTRRY